MRSCSSDVLQRNNPYAISQLVEIIMLQYLPTYVPTLSLSPSLSDLSSILLKLCSLYYIFNLMIVLLLPFYLVYRSSERSARDVDAIAHYLDKWRCLDSLSENALRRLASTAYLEDFDDGVTRKSFRQTLFL